MRARVVVTPNQTKPKDLKHNASDITDKDDGRFYGGEEEDKEDSEQSYKIDNQAAKSCI